MFLDEASSLLNLSQTKLEGREEHLTKFRLLRRIASKLFRNMSILFVISSTNSHLGEFVSNKFTMTESERPYFASDKYISSPFYKILFIDALVPITYFNNLKSNLYVNITNRDPFEGLFYHGRPLWGALIESNKKENKVDHAISYDLQLQNLMSFVMHKLIFSEKWADINPKNDENNFDKIFAAIALISVRTSFNISFKIPQSTKMITKHLSTLYYISQERTECEFRYFSEPILASGNLKNNFEIFQKKINFLYFLASAQIMSNERNYYDILNNFNYYIQETDLEITGGIGEIISQIILLRAFDKAAASQILQNKYYSNSVTVKDFLKQLFGNQILIDTVDNHVLSGIVSFNHFIKRIGEDSNKSLNYDVILSRFIARCAAGHFENRHEGIDFFIPIVFENNKISYIFIQTKNWKSKYLNADLIDKKFGKGIKNDLFTDNQKVDVIRIVFFIGNELNEKEKFVKRGLLPFDSQTLKESKLFDEETLNLINTILWSNRFILNDEKYDKNVIKQVTIGSGEFD